MMVRNLSARSSYILLETDESKYYLPTADWMVPLSLGYREAAAGVVWVRLLTYFGEQHEVRGDFSHLEAYLTAVTSLDPYFYRAYTWGSVAAIYNGTLIDREAIELSIDMLERGLEYFPNDGDIHYYLGFQYYFELGALTTGEERERVRRIGLDEICTGAILGGGPPFLPLVCSSLAERQGLDHIATQRLSQVLIETEDERTRARIEERLEQLMSPDAAYLFTRRIAEFRRRWRREMPYAPAGFYLLVGPREVRPRVEQVELPLPMDAMIQAELEELFISDDRVAPAPELSLEEMLEQADGEPGDEEVTVDPLIEVETGEL